MKRCHQTLVSLAALALVTCVLAACAGPSQLGSGSRQAGVGLSTDGPVLGG